MFNFNLWLTYQLGFQGVLTPLTCGLVLLILVPILSLVLHEDGFTPLQHPKTRLGLIAVTALVVGFSLFYLSSVYIDERLGVAERMLYIREHGGMSLHRPQSFLSPKSVELADSFAWTCSTDKSPWECVKGKHYRQNDAAFIP